MHRRFTLAVFVGAALLFTLEPLTGRLVLPLAGGTPAVWTTCLLFFQAVLLAGYAYAHVISSRCPMRVQAPLHLAVLGVAAVSLPIALGANWLADSQLPVLMLLLQLLKMVGLPFFALSTTAPLMQRWLASAAPHQDPYPLYAASNAGSLLALAAYPFIVEPALGLGAQGRWWAWGYGGYALLIVSCAAMAWRAKSSTRPIERVITQGPWRRWLLLSLAPSSLLMGITTAITTDITPIPLLWVVPLALYLLTFILAFAARPIIPHWLTLRVAPICVLALFFALLTGATSPWTAVLAVNLLAFFFISLACHGELSRLRPPVEGLTGYYLLISVGGVIGGAFNALLAPILFRKIGLAEYPLMLALAVALLPVRPRAKAFEGIPELTGLRSLIYPAVIAGIALGLILGAQHLGWNESLVGSIIFGIPLVLVYFLVDRPRRFAAALLMLWTVSWFYIGETGVPLFRERNFFGIVRVTADLRHDAHVLIHGNTIHGRQNWRDGRGVNEPLAYYTRQGPIGDVFRVTAQRGHPPVAVCGLGAGSVAAYAQPDQPWSFFEIDPAMIQVAQSSSLFSFLADNFPEGRNLSIALGDARIEMARSRSGEFGLIVLDAFSSDSIPVHLLTREALLMYLDKLADNGLLAFHISNRYLDLKPVLAAVAKDLSLSACYRFDEVPPEVAAETGALSSIWVVLARQPGHLDRLSQEPGWRALPPPRAGFRVWTDDFSNLIGVLMWERD